MYTVTVHAVAIQQCTMSKPLNIFLNCLLRLWQTSDGLLCYVLPPEKFSLAEV